MLTRTLAAAAAPALLTLVVGLGETATGAVIGAAAALAAAALVVRTGASRPA